MKVEIQQTSENKTLHRKEIIGTLSYKGVTPSREDVRAALAKELKAKPDVLVCKKIETHFGGNVAKIEAFVYETPEYLQKTETPKFVKQAAKKEEPKAEEKPAEEKKEKTEAADEKKTEEKQ